ncbi:MAG: citramalate synthase [Verrucomicrobiota bacterium]|nr:citramalate synthase [Verrucomicrobiota bacterium]
MAREKHNFSERPHQITPIVHKSLCTVHLLEGGILITDIKNTFGTFVPCYRLLKSAVFSAPMKSGVTLYDTTLRDGSQGEDINFSLTDKIRIAEKLDQFGMHYIEGGWPGSNPKDIAFFHEASKRKWHHAKIAAFGSTRKAGTPVESDDQVRLLLEAETPVITFFGKTWLLQVTEVLRTTPDENLAMIGDTTRFLKDHGREVIYDAEHFFDGYKDNPAYAIDSLLAAEKAGADFLVLCDTCGGTMPEEIERIVQEVRKRVTTKIGIHTHNDCGLGVANAIIAIQNGAVQVQGTINGYGERTGNCNLTTVIPTLAIKMKVPVVNSGQLKHLRELSLFVDEIANVRHDIRAPYIGQTCFAHKGGMHVNAVQKLARTYEHIEPETVGNVRRILVGELSGRSNILMKAEELGYKLDKDLPEVKKILSNIKKLESEGYEFEAAEGSLDLLIKKALGNHKRFFELLEYHVTMFKSSDLDALDCEATVKLKIDGEETLTAAEGDGPVNALDTALRKTLERYYPSIKKVELTDYKVRILESHRGTSSRTRVFILSSDGHKQWGTVGVSDNLVEASWIALVDSFDYYLLRNHKR